MGWRRVLTYQRRWDFSKVPSPEMKDTRHRRLAHPVYATSTGCADVALLTDAGLVPLLAADASGTHRVAR